MRAAGQSKAITAAAHKLARLIYMMLTKGEEYVDQGQDYFEERYRQRVLHHLAKRAEKLGMKTHDCGGRRIKSLDKTVAYSVFLTRRCSGRSGRWSR